MREPPSSATASRFDPLEAAQLIGDSYRRYLKARYAPADDELRAELHDALDNRFSSYRGPFSASRSGLPRRPVSPVTDLRGAPTPPTR